MLVYVKWTCSALTDKVKDVCVSDFAFFAAGLSLLFEINLMGSHSRVVTTAVGGFSHTFTLNNAVNILALNCPFSHEAHNKRLCVSDEVL